MANMSHELRTPLNALIGFSDLQTQQVHGPMGHESYLEYATEINKSSRGLLEMINNILDITRMESGDFELASNEFEVSRLLDQVINLQKNQAVLKNIQIVTHFPEEHLILTADEKRLKQALNSLLSNAIKFSHEGGQVAVCAELTGEGNLDIQVVDEGIGMNEEDTEKAMESFGQIHFSYDYDYDGAGLGLSLTKKILELHSGYLKLSSETGNGTTATVCLPASRVSQFQRSLSAS